MNTHAYMCTYENTHHTTAHPLGDPGEAGSMHGRFPFAGCCGKDSPCRRDHTAHPPRGGGRQPHTPPSNAKPRSTDAWLSDVTEKHRRDDVAEHVCVIKHTFKNGGIHQVSSETVYLLQSESPVRKPLRAGGLKTLFPVNMLVHTIK